MEIGPSALLVGGMILVQLSSDQMRNRQVVCDFILE